jgi:hypothetical protein
MNELLKFFFPPSVKSYLTKNKTLLDNTLGHDSELASALIATFFIRVKFLSPSTTSLTQPMDQPVIADFRRLYTKKVIHK